MTTSRLIFRANDFAARVDAFDPTFSQRYLASYVMEGFGTSYDLQGEKHWEADKYNILFIDCADEKVPQFIGDMKECGICEVLAEADDKYEVVGDTLYVDAGLLELFKKQNMNVIRQNMARREKDFKPKLSPDIY